MICSKFNAIELLFIIFFFCFVLVGSASNELLKIELNTLPLFECNKTLLEYNRARNLASFRGGIEKSQYCAHDPNGRRDSCQGDSGGPLQTIRSYSNPSKVVAVVSFGIGCGQGKPGIYTRVAHYIEWIGSQVWPNGEIEIPQINIYGDDSDNSKYIIV